MRRALAGQSEAVGLIVRTLLALVGAALVGSIFLAIDGVDLGFAYQEIFEQSFGSSFAVKNSLIEAVPITLVALGVAVAFRAGIFNLGGEGQIYMGALFAVLVVLGLSGLPGPVLIVLGLIGGAIGGGLWGGVAGALRSRLGLSEIITTIMLNFIAFWIVSYLVRGPIQDPDGAGYPYTKEIPAKADLPTLFGTIPLGAVLLVVAAVVVWILLERTKTGISIKSLGAGEAAGRFSGLNVERTGFAVLLIAGVLGGLAGAASLLGNEGRLSDFFSPGWGFVGVMTALIGRGTAIGTLVAGLLIGFLNNGITGAQSAAGIPTSTAQILVGVFVLFLIIVNTDIVATALRRAASSLKGGSRG
ncbi:MAG: ABC transporter permease [Solirubrobacterales bacterium]|nr:ABC transporter permease [Solirubrobacterales bacterium]